MDAPDIGTGTTITFVTSAFSAWIRDITQLYSATRGEVDISHMGTTGGREFIPTDLYDGGHLNFEILFDPDDNPPITGAKETVQIDLPSGSQIQFSIFMVEFTPAVPFEDLMMATCSFKVSGDVTHVPAGSAGSSGAGGSAFEI